MEGKRVEMSPIDLNVKFVDTKNPIDGISNATVLRAAAMLGFSFPDDRHTEILDFLNKAAESYLSGLPQYTVLERERIDDILTDRGLSLSDLMDTENAIEVGESISANYILTGSVIEMS